MMNGLTFQMSRCGRHVVERTKGGGVVKPVPGPPAVFCRLKLWPAPVCSGAFSLPGVAQEACVWSLWWVLRLLCSATELHAAHGPVPTRVLSE